MCVIKKVVLVWMQCVIKKVVLFWMYKIITIQNQGLVDNWTFLCRCAVRRFFQ